MFYANIVWFQKPKYMSESLYQYFGTVIQPLIKNYEGKCLQKLECFKSTKPYSPGSFWIHPPEPAILLAQHRFELAMLTLPCIYLHLPHFYVNTLRCPNCSKELEKNGALRLHPLMLRSCWSCRS